MWGSVASLFGMSGMGPPVAGTSITLPRTCRESRCPGAGRASCSVSTPAQAAGGERMGLDPLHRRTCSGLAADIELLAHPCHHVACGIDDVGFEPVQGLATVPGPGPQLVER